MEHQTTGNNIVGHLKSSPEFQEYKKIPRLNRDMIITEKIDGTNACVYITDEGDIYAGKRTSWCTPEKDNYGFARWVQENKVELLKLGPGRHFGEWWGKGINRNYGIQNKRFSLFNTSLDRNSLPSCVDLVPVLYSGIFNAYSIEHCVSLLRQNGSFAVPGWMTPEGIVIYHKASGTQYKVTCVDDEKPKNLPSKE